MNPKPKYLGITVLALALAIAGGYVVFARTTQGETVLRSNTPPELPSAARRVTVQVTRAEQRKFEEKLTVQGNVMAKVYAVISARVGGPLETIFVDEGDAVVAGETKLFQVDTVKVLKAVTLSEQDLAVTRCGLREAQAQLEKIEADLNKADLDWDRFQRLREKGVVSQDLLEQQESRQKQTSAGKKLALTGVDVAAERVRQAETAVALAKKDLADSLIVAPISGKVSKRFREQGEMTDSGSPVVRIDDPSVIEVSVFLPAQYYARVVPGTTRIRIRVYGVDAGEHVITYASPTVDPMLRTFEVKCELKDPPSGIVPGAMAEADVLIAEREALGVPANAVQTRDERPIVFVAENDTAHLVEVKKGIESDGWVECEGGSLAAGTEIITVGQSLLNDGSPITVQQEPK